MTYETRVTRLPVTPSGTELFHEFGTNIEIVDEAAGEFVELSQETGKIRIDPTEWPTLRAAINRMVAECRPEESKEGVQ